MLWSGRWQLLPGAHRGNGSLTLTGSFTDTLVLASGAFSFTGQTAGLYDVKIEDSEGSIFITTIELIEPAEIIATAVITDATCPSDSEDGAIDLTVSGGTGPSIFSTGRMEQSPKISVILQPIITV